MLGAQNSNDSTALPLANYLVENHSMYLYNVIPLTKLPRPQLQTPQYFSSQKFEIGQLVIVPLGKRTVPAVIMTSSDALGNKQAIRKSSYTLRNIEHALVDHATFDKKFLDVARHLADYYFVSVGLMLRRMLPPFFSKPTRPLLKMLNSLPKPQTTTLSQKGSQELIITNKKESYYKKIKTEGLLFLVPEYLQIPFVKKLIPNLSTLSAETTNVQWRTLWQQAYLGKISALVGTRAALFTPLKNLKTIVVENENNTSHKSWDQHPKFDTRYSARVLSSAYGTRLVLADTIPSIETWWHAQHEKWRIEQEFSKTPSPQLIDMREELKNKNFSILSVELQAKIRSIKNEGKMFLFINRRGISSALLCRDCGFIIKCENCSTPFVLHRGTLICHRCADKLPPPSTCPDCGGSRIKHLGGGTQHVENEVKRIAPHLNIIRLDTDSVASAEAQAEILKDFQKGRYQILIGTKLAFKEYLLPRLDASAVVMYDTLLNLPAYRSSESVYETIWRLRQLTRDKVLVQTYNPEIPLFSYMRDDSFEPFFKGELEKRKALHYPPFSQLIKLTYGHPDEQKAEEEAKILKQKLEVQLEALTNGNKKNHRPQAISHLQILGPAPAFIPRVRGRYLWYILIKWPKKNGKIKDLSLRNRLLDIVPKEWDIDVDPIDIV